MMNISRRGLIGLSIAASAGVMMSTETLASPAGEINIRSRYQDAPTGPFTLPDLPYDVSALEPHIDTATMEIHHGKHHATYVSNLNKAVADHADLQAKSALELITDLASVPEEIRNSVRNNGGGHVNHSMFWEIMQAPADSSEPGEVGEAINSAFGSVDAMAEAVNAAGLSRFGSGWAWMVLGGDGKLATMSTPNQDNPVSDGSGIPILGIDVWEHAYYLKYQNKRADYLTAWWNVINWSKVNERYLAAKSQ